MDTTMLARSSALVALTAAAVVAVALPVAASGPPTGECATAFTLRPVSDFGQGFQAHLAKTDRNGDLFVCTQQLPEALPFPNINFVDNVVQT